MYLIEWNTLKLDVQDNMLDTLKQLMNKNQKVMYLFSSIYNILHYNNSWEHKFSNRFSWKGAFLRKTYFHIEGKNNIIELGVKARLYNCRFTLLGNNCKIIIGGNHTIISNVHFWCQDDNSTIIIGDNFTMEGGHIAATEGKSIKIGNDCMFSNDIEIRNGDSHSIINLDGNKRINHAEDVCIEDHVWLTAHVKILKGSIIPSNSIIGNSSVVSHKFHEKNAIYAGIPCKLLRQNIDWERNKL